VSAPPRSIPLKAVVRPAAADGVDLVNRWPEPAIAGAVPGAIDWSATSVDLADDAVMDVAIGADTLAAHLAGALGLRVIVALNSHGDWRWG